MKRFLLLFLLWLGVCSNLMAKPTIQGEAQIKGQIESTTTSAIEFIIRNSPLDNFPISYTASPDTNGYFNLCIPVDHFSEGIVILGHYRYKIALMPGDRLNLTIKGIKVTYQGKGSEKNNLLYSLKNSGLSNLQAPSVTLNLIDFADSLNKQKEQRLNFLKNYPDAKMIETEFKKWFNMDTQVQYEQIMLGRISSSDSILPPIYRKIQHPRNLLNDRKLISVNYINLINKQYLSGENFKRTFSNLKQKGVAAPQASYAATNELLEKLPPLTREYMLAYLLQQEMTFQQKYDTSRLQWFQAIAKNSIPIGTVNTAIEKLKFKKSLIGQQLHPEFSQTLLVDTAGNILTFGEMMKQHQGKVVYLDIWSLSCSPCRWAMPGSQLLRKKLSDLPITFVYLIPDNSFKQKKEVKKLTGTLENNYQLLKGFNSRLFRSMQIFWVPVYMIFDKQGRLINYCAIGPEHTKENEISILEKQLRRLAEE